MKLSDTKISAPEIKIDEDCLANWPEGYYEESDPARRLAMLEQAMSAGLSLEEDSCRKTVFDLRYKKKSDGSYADLFILNFMDFCVLSKNNLNRFGKAHERKDALKKLKSMGIGADVKDRELFDNVLLQEFCHMTRVYIGISADSRQYTSVLFGFGKISDAKLLSKLNADMDAAGKTVADMLDLRAEMNLWIRGIEEARAKMLG